LNLLSGVMHLVHDATVKFAKSWLFLLVALVSGASMSVHAREIDMTNWREMGDETYQATLRGIEQGDTLKYVIKGKTNIFNIEGHLKKAPGAVTSFSENFILDNERVLQVPSSIILGHTLVNFMEGHDAFEKAGINVVKVYPESDPENFIIKEYVPHISFRALLFLLVDNNAGYVTYELNRRVSLEEREAMKAETIKFIESLAVISEAFDFGIQQIVYDIKAKRPLVLDFLAEPKLYDPSSNEPQPNVLEEWTDFDYGKKYGEAMEGQIRISVRAFKFISHIYEQQRLNLNSAFQCKMELNLATPKLKPIQKPQGPTGT
jgi:hypothetical protein